MNKIRCIIVDDEATARKVIQLHLEQLDHITIVAKCKNATEALAAINQYPVDLIFLDINMPDMSGISLTKSIPKTIKVIFTTAYREYAIDDKNLIIIDTYKHGEDFCKNR